MHNSFVSLLRQINNLYSKNGLSCCWKPLFQMKCANFWHFVASQFQWPRHIAQECPVNIKNMQFVLWHNRFWNQIKFRLMYRKARRRSCLNKGQRWHSRPNRKKKRQRHEESLYKEAQNDIWNVIIMLSRLRCESIWQMNRMKKFRRNSN